MTGSIKRCPNGVVIKIPLFLWENSLHDSLSKSPWNVPNGLLSKKLWLVVFRLISLVSDRSANPFLEQTASKDFCHKKPEILSGENTARTYAVSCMYLSYSLSNWRHKTEWSVVASNLLETWYYVVRKGGVPPHLCCHTQRATSHSFIMLIMPQGPWRYCHEAPCPSNFYPTKLIVTLLIIKWWTWQGKCCFKILLSWHSITRHNSFTNFWLLVLVLEDKESRLEKKL